MEVRHVVSVVITSMPLRKSTGRPATPGPANSSTRFFTKPDANVALTSDSATSCGPTPRRGAPVRYTSTTSGAGMSYVFLSSCLTSSGPPSPTPMVPSAP